MMKILSNSKNFKGNVESEFNWVVKVLKSSERMSHINTSTKLFNNFLQKWGEKLKTPQKYEMVINFTEEKRKTIHKMTEKA